MTILHQPPPLPPVRPRYEPASATEARSRLVGVVHYRDDEATVDASDGTVSVVVPSPRNDLTETWPAEGEQTDSGTSGDVCWAHDGENLFAAVSAPDAGVLGERVREAYTALLSTTADLGFTCVYRIWNYLGRINHSNSVGLERYRDFCMGRSEAFEDMAWAPDALPSGTGIGYATGGLTVFLLARRTADAFNIENPLQMPAYEYPDTYGPRSPSFARATAVGSQKGQSIFVSGTASIRGHRTIGSSLDEQIMTTIENLDTLLSTYDGKEARFKTLKIYVRRPQHMLTVADAFRERYGLTAQEAPVLQADICRSDLLLEVEGVAAPSWGADR